MTAKLFSDRVRVAILPAAKPLAIAAAVFQQKNFSCRVTNAFDFLKRRHGIGKGAG